MKKSIVFLLMIFMCFIAGCGEQEEAAFIFGTDLCEYDMYIESGNDIGINFPFAYNVSKEDIKLLGLEGYNIDISEISFFDDTIEPCNGVEINGYKLGFLGLKVEGCKKSFTINKLNIEIAGKEESLIFDFPLTIHICDNGNEIYERNTADYIGSTGAGKNSLMYSFFVNNNVIITGYDMTGPYIVEKADISSGDIEISRLPYEMHKDEGLLFWVDTNTIDEDGYKFLGFNFLVKYTNEEGEECTYYVPVRQQGAGDEESCYNILKLMVEKYSDEETR